LTGLAATRGKKNMPKKEFQSVRLQVEQDKIMWTLATINKSHIFLGNATYYSDFLKLPFPFFNVPPLLFQQLHISQEFRCLQK
jgi:hypothetical protein